MALPTLTTLKDCADFTLTVRPYIGQLTVLPQQLLQSWSNPQELKEIYMATNPLISAFAMSLFLSPIFLIISEINKNYSQVDRAWSLLPTMYNLHFVVYAHMAGLPTQRMDTMLAFSAVWSVRFLFHNYRVHTKAVQLRLTFNYWRKGGYSIGSEDYRW
jgi:steroid 5-alpha reductase family enzyme